MRAQRTYVELVYEGVDITRDISADLLSFTWNDNASGQSDDVQIDLKNTHGRWHGEWYPQKGDHIKATIVVESGVGSRAQIYCGSFYVDELDFKGPPSTVSIKAQSVPQGNDVRTTKRRKAWEDVSLQEIAQDIADRAGLTLLYDVSESFFYDRVDQRESDLKFLGRMCKEEGFALKVTGEQIVIFSEEEYDAKAPSDVIQLGQSRIVSWSFSSKAYELVKETVVKYYDPDKGETIERSVKVKPRKKREAVDPFTSLTRAGFDVPPPIQGPVLPPKKKKEKPKTVDPFASLTRAGFELPDVNAAMDVGTTDVVNVRASSMGEAERKGKAVMRSKNKNEVTGTLNMQGDLRLIAGLTVELRGFGYFDADYFVEKTTHTVRGGYTTSVELRRVLEGY